MENKFIIQEIEIQMKHHKAEGNDEAVNSLKYIKSILGKKD